MNDTRVTRAMKNLPPTDASVHESALINAFTLKERKARLLEFLEISKRQKLHALLHHFKCLDDRFARPLPPGIHTPAQIAALLAQRGAPPTCLIITSFGGLDRLSMPLLDALTAIVGQQCGALISCIPGRLAYFEGEEPGMRYVLERSQEAPRK